MRRISKPEDIKVAVVGYGGTFNMGRFHLNEAKQAGITPCAAADIDPERLKTATTDTLQIINSEIVEITGFLWSGIWNNKTVWKSDTNEDDAFVAVRYANGAWSTLAISSIESRQDSAWFKITGTKGACIPGWNTTEIIVYDGDKRITTRVPNPKAEYWRFYSNIVEHLTKGKPLVITPEWARRTVHVLEMACQSAKLKRALKPIYK